MGALLQTTEYKLWQNKNCDEKNEVKHKIEWKRKDETEIWQNTLYWNTNWDETDNVIKHKMQHLDKTSIVMNRKYDEAECHETQKIKQDTNSEKLKLPQTQIVTM